MTNWHKEPAVFFFVKVQIILSDLALNAGAPDPLAGREERRGERSWEFLMPDALLKSLFWHTEAQSGVEHVSSCVASLGTGTDRGSVRSNRLHCVARVRNGGWVTQGFWGGGVRN